jgi:hypothetical protein
MSARILSRIRKLLFKIVITYASGDYFIEIPELLIRDWFPGTFTWR